MTHTSVPWSITAKPKGWRFIGTADKQKIAVVEIRDEGDAEDDANAHFIVQACNSHAQLLEALTEVLNEARRGKDADAYGAHVCHLRIIRTVNAAIAQAAEE